MLSQMKGARREPSDDKRDCCLAWGRSLLPDPAPLQPRVSVLFRASPIFF
jgi:hypothetical protein